MSKVRDAMEQLRQSRADDYRRAGKLPDTRAIEKEVREDFRRAEHAAKRGTDHPLNKNRGGER